MGLTTSTRPHSVSYKLTAIDKLVVTKRVLDQSKPDEVSFMLAVWGPEGRLLQPNGYDLVIHLTEAQLMASAQGGVQALCGPEELLCRYGDELRLIKMSYDGTWVDTWVQLPHLVLYHALAAANLAGFDQFGNATIEWLVTAADKLFYTPNIKVNWSDEAMAIFQRRMYTPAYDLGSTRTLSDLVMERCEAAKRYSLNRSQVVELNIYADGPDSLGFTEVRPDGKRGLVGGIIYRDGVYSVHT